MDACGFVHNPGAGGSPSLRVLSILGFGGDVGMLASRALQAAPGLAVLRMSLSGPPLHVHGHVQGEGAWQRLHELSLPEATFPLQLWLSMPALRQVHVHTVVAPPDGATTGGRDVEWQACRLDGGITLGDLARMPRMPLCELSMDCLLLPGPRHADAVIEELVGAAARVLRGCRSVVCSQREERDLELRVDEGHLAACIPLLGLQGPGLDIPEWDPTRRQADYKRFAERW
jgi:hypothetical protein